MLPRQCACLWRRCIKSGPPAPPRPRCVRVVQGCLRCSTPSDRSSRKAGRPRSCVGARPAVRGASAQMGTWRAGRLSTRSCEVGWRSTRTECRLVPMACCWPRLT